MTLISSCISCQISYFHTRIFRIFIEACCGYFGLPSTCCLAPRSPQCCNTVSQTAGMSSFGQQLNQAAHLRPPFPLGQVPQGSPNIIPPQQQLPPYIQQPAQHYGSLSSHTYTAHQQQGSCCNKQQPPPKNCCQSQHAPPCCSMVPHYVTIQGEYEFLIERRIVKYL